MFRNSIKNTVKYNSKVNKIPWTLRLGMYFHYGPGTVRILNHN